MRSDVRYLISGQTLPSTGGYACNGVDNFSVSLHASSFTGVPATGTCNIDVLLDDSSPWVTIFSHSFAGNSGIITQLNGPFSQIRGGVLPTTTLPFTGTFSIICRSSWYKD